MWDLLSLTTGAIISQRLRSLLSILGIAIGVASVTLLTTVGESTRRYIMTQFTQFGTNLLAINPGKTETVGIPGVLGGTTKKLTLHDAKAIARLPYVEHVMPVAMGQGRVEIGSRGRSVPIYGVTAEAPHVWKFAVRQGSFLPPGDPTRGGAVTVLGPTLKRELFGETSALGKWVRIAGTRLQVIGVMAPKGRILGLDIDDSAYVPVATAMRMFNLDELMEIDVVFTHERLTDEVAESVRVLLTARHRGNEDFTITTQTAMLDVFGNVMTMITAAMGAIGGISLLVGAIGILTMMWIAVGERTHEIGLMRALGATARQVLLIFLGEAIVLALIGGVSGVTFGLGVVWLLKVGIPGLPVAVPFEFVLAGLGVSFVTGLLSGVLPARRAARLDPIDALRTE
ncbi:MAG: ABC transporter permease [Planctomycetota bacterium]|jgi:putative ABC transport system permease protein